MPFHELLGGGPLGIFVAGSRLIRGRGLPSGTRLDIGGRAARRGVIPGPGETIVFPGGIPPIVGVPGSSTPIPSTPIPAVVPPPGQTLPADPSPTGSQAQALGALLRSRGFFANSVEKSKFDLDSLGSVRALEKLCKSIKPRSVPTVIARAACELLSALPAIPRRPIPRKPRRTPPPKPTRPRRPVRRPNRPPRGVPPFKPPAPFELDPFPRPTPPIVNPRPPIPVIRPLPLPRTLPPVPAPIIPGVNNPAAEPVLTPPLRRGGDFGHPVEIISPLPPFKSPPQPSPPPAVPGAPPQGMPKPAPRTNPFRFPFSDLSRLLRTRSSPSPSSPAAPLTPIQPSGLPLTRFSAQPQPNLDPCRAQRNRRRKKKKKKCVKRYNLVWAGGPKKGKLAGSKCFRSMKLRGI